MIAPDTLPARIPLPACAPARRVAVIGSGISGLAAARLLARRFSVTLFEAQDRAGGHAHTVDVEVDGVPLSVDTGFLVFNDRTYPNLVALFDELGVASIPSPMTFGVSLDGGRLEWSGTSLDTVFAQRRRAFSPRFLRMLADVLRFNREAAANLDAACQRGQALGGLLEEGRYGAAFRDDYLLPMAAAIWSCPSAQVLAFPAATFLRFCINHGLLQIADRPQWRTVAGGSRRYVQRMLAGLPDVRLACPVQRVRRGPAGVVLHSRQGEERFDAVVFATHAPDTLALLEDADEQERATLGAFRYQPNRAVLHTDERLLPRLAKVRSAWNYLGRSGERGSPPVCVSYWLNPLQSLPVATPVIVTLNPWMEPAPGKVLGSYDYAHPLFDHTAIAAQGRLPGLQGHRNTWHAGAWTGYGFHEDGLKSALQVAAAFGVRLEGATA